MWCHRHPIVLLLLVIIIHLCCLCQAWMVGTGISDITGSMMDVHAMGFPTITLRGLHTRLYSRAFVFKDSQDNLFAYVVADMAMISTLVKYEVLERISSQLPGLFTAHNFMIAATHTHAGPGGYNSELLYLLSSHGLSRSVVSAIADGIVKSVVRAHKTLQPARLYFSKGKLYNVSANRHPKQYELNLESDRLRYQGNTDSDMQLLKIVSSSSNGDPLGSIAWFPVHATNMKDTNIYVSGDNKGIASQLMERYFNPHALPGDGSFVAAFPQSNSGDVTPNFGGIVNLTTGGLCDPTYKMNAYVCTSKGPGNDILESAEIVGRKQFEKALKLFKQSNQEEIQDSPIQLYHDVIHFNNFTFLNPFLNGSLMSRTCSAAAGYPFAAGSIDGHGIINYFVQGKQQNSSLINRVRDFLSPVTDDDQECHSTKNILLNLGKMKWNDNYFAGNSLPVHVVKMGSIVIAALPAEFTTMSGRLIKETLSKDLERIGQPELVISALTNGYSLYVTTPAEYKGTYYEGGATLFGPNTLAAYIYKLKQMLSSFGGSQSVIKNDAIGFYSGVRANQLDQLVKDSSDPTLLPDFSGVFSEFGDVVVEPNENYTAGDTVFVEFVATDPRKSIRKHLFSHLYIETQRSVNNWAVVCTDACFENNIEWKRRSFFKWHAKIHWRIPVHQRPGLYRLRFLGNTGDRYRPYQGLTNRFTIHQMDTTDQTSVWNKDVEVSLAYLLHREFIENPRIRLAASKFSNSAQLEASTNQNAVVQKNKKSVKSSGTLSSSLRTLLLLLTHIVIASNIFL